MRFGDSLLRGRRGPAGSLAFLLGASGALGFAPLSWWPFAILAPAGLIALWLLRDGRDAAWLGYLFGFGWFGAGVHWVWYSAYAFGGTPIPVAVGINVALIAFLALYPALLGGLAGRFLPRLTAPAVVFAVPSAWVLLEWLRGEFLTGFTWLNPGYALSGSWLAGFAPIGGVNLLAWGGVLTATVLGLVAVRRLRCVWLLLPAAAWGLGALLGHIDWTQRLEKTLDVALIQGNIDQGEKWRPEHRWRTMRRYVSLSAPHLDADLIVWPETALPMFFDQAATWLADLEARARASGATLMIGAPVRESNGDYYNSVVAIGASRGRYDKRHLVPFGEYVPLESVLGRAIQFLDVPMSRFSVGAERQAVIDVGGAGVALTICYEDAFAPVTHAYDGDAAILLNVSNDAWFGPTWAPAQHLQMARMRALESQRTLVRGTNTGISAMIGADGRFLAIGESWVETVVRMKLPLFKGRTPYMRLGDGVWMWIFGGLLVVAARRGLKPLR